MRNSKQFVISIGKLALFGLVGLYVCRKMITILTPGAAILGVLDGQLVDCPDSPNCVSSQADNYGHKTDPIRYTTSTVEAKAKLMGVLAAMPRVAIIVEQPNYVHAEFRTALVNYTDDVEFYFDEQNKIIHLRSASRLGYYDLGVNRKRVEEIRKRFNGAN